MKESYLVFVRHYLKTNNATQSAIAAGYSKRSAHDQGHKLLNNAEIQKAIEKEQEKRRKEFNIRHSPESIMDDFFRLQKKAEEAGQFNAATNAATARAKVQGMFVARSLVETRNLDLNSEEVRLKVIEAVKKLQITADELK